MLSSLDAREWRQLSAAKFYQTNKIWAQFAALARQEEEEEERGASDGLLLPEIGSYNSVV